MSSFEPSPHDEGVEDLHPVSVVYEFGVNKFVENIAVRRTGQILVTVHNTNDLIEINPHPKTQTRLVHHFAKNLFGIVEVQEDVFYVSEGTIGQQNSFAIYKVDMSVATDKVSKLVDVPDALFLNGSALLSPSSGLILVADSILGAVFVIDTQAATVKTWLQHSALTKVTTNPNYPGVNGIKIHKGYLYLSNTEARTFLRAGLNADGEALGTVEVLENGCNIDDFVFDADGSAYLTCHVFNSVVKLRSNGARSRIAGGPEDTIVAGTTAAAFGRTPSDRTTLYVTTNGGMSYPVHGKVEPGRLLSLQVGVSGALD